MTKIKFNCPSCLAKLKVPVELAGIAGPCPQCGGTIVAPLQPQVNQNAVKQEPVMASAVGNSQAPVQQQPPVIAPTVVEQPLQPAVHAQAPQVIPEPQVQPQMQQQPLPQPVVEELPPFPMPLEQVSQTAAVALQNPALAPQPGPVLPMPEPALAPNNGFAQTELPHGEDIFDQQVGLPGPETQPIIVKKKSVEELPLPALSEQLPLDTALTDIGADYEEGYQPPNPVALTPPSDELIGVEEIPFEEAFEPQPEIEAEFPLEDDSELLEVVEEPIEEIEEVADETQDSMAALLGEAADPEQKSKDEILNDLLGVAPAKFAKKKKGLSAFSIAALTILILVAIGMIIVVISVGTKFGGFASQSQQDVLGKQGQQNIDPRDKNLGAEKLTAKTPIDTKDEAEVKELPFDDHFENYNKNQAARKAAAKAEADKKAAEEAAAKAATPNRAYDPLDVYPAPGPDDRELTNTQELIDAFLRAPDWKTQAKYVYRGNSLRPTIEKYHKTNQYSRYNQYLPKIFQMELDPDYGGPFWVFQITENSNDPGIPLLIRPENGNLKVDWEIFTEFKDEHFLKYTAGDTSGDRNFHLVVEQVSQYPGSDREVFKDLDTYDCYKVYPPYGAFDQNKVYAFVKKNTPLATELGSKFSVNNQGLAASIKIEQQSFPHGIRHYVLKEFHEGWLRKQ